MTEDLKLKTVNCFCSSLATHHSSLPLKISAGQFFDLLLPISFGLAVILSAWVLASARKHHFSSASVTLWTLGTLFFPLIILPLYLFARSFKRTSENERAVDDDNESSQQAKSASPVLPLRKTLPLVYLLTMMSLSAIYFYMDWQSVDAHLARANQARVADDKERVVAEYRAALKLENDAHTHYLLGKALLDMKHWDEALAEFYLAERMGDADEELPLNIAALLDRLQRPAEARIEYERFSRSELCTEMPHDERCQSVRVRLKELSEGGSR